MNYNRFIMYVYTLPTVRGATEALKSPWLPQLIYTEGYEIQLYIEIKLYACSTLILWDIR